jgi:hypothetical protein
MKYLGISDPKQLAAGEPIRPKTCRAFLPRMADQEVAETGGWLPLYLVDSAWGSRMGLLFGCSAECDPPPFYYGCCGYMALKRRIQSRDGISYKLIHYIYT